MHIDFFQDKTPRAHIVKVSKISKILIIGYYILYKLYTLYIFVLYYYYVDYTIILTKLNYIQYIVEDGRALINKYWKEIRIKTIRAKYGTGPFRSLPPMNFRPPYPSTTN